jgi:hypothetical protein
MSIQLSKNFTLDEFLVSEKAKDMGVSNAPSWDEHDRVLEELTSLVKHVWQPVRDRFGPVKITSGFRNYIVNKAVGGDEKSQHRKGEAGDGEVPGVDNLTVARWIVANCSFDQLILEGYSGGNTGWIHVSHKANKPNRKEVLTAPIPSKRSTWFKGLPTSSSTAAAGQVVARAPKFLTILGIGGDAWYFFQKR